MIRQSRLDNEAVPRAAHGIRHLYCHNPRPQQGGGGFGPGGGSGGLDSDGGFGGA